MTRADVPRYHAEPVETDWPEVIAAWQAEHQLRAPVNPPSNLIEPLDWREQITSWNGGHLGATS